MKRRSFLRATSLGSTGLLASQAASAQAGRGAPSGRGVVHDMSAEIVEYGKPVFDLHKFFTSPVKIAAIELLQSGNQYFLRTRSTDGAEGIVQCKDIADYIQILAHRVMPHFLNQDARDLEHLVDEVYVT